LEVVPLIFIFAPKIHFYVKIHFYIKMKIRKTISPVTLILMNVIQDMILNNIQEVLAVDRTPCVVLMSAVFSSLITRKVHEQIFYYNVLESSQEYTMKNRILFKKFSDIALTLVTLLKIRSLNRSFRILQLLSKTFFFLKCSIFEIKGVYGVI